MNRKRRHKQDRKVIENRRLLLEALDKRELLAADAGIAFDPISGSALVGERLELSFEFSGSGSPTDVGFGPYVDLIVPAAGRDGDDGLHYVSGSSSVLGSSLSETVLTIGTDGSVAHPFAVDAEGSPLQVAGNAGDQLVVLTLPVGSYLGDQPSLEVEFQVDVDRKADVGETHSILATGGYRFGQDALDNPSTDPMLRGVTSKLDVVPQVVSVNVEFSGSEDETAVGSNFTNAYVVTVDIADGVQLSNLQLQNQLDENQVYLGLTSKSSWDTISEPDATSLPNESLVNLVRQSVVGQAGVDATYELSFYVATADTNGETVSPLTGESVLSEFRIATLASWQAIDERDQGSELSTFESELSIAHELQDQAVAIQSSVGIDVDNSATGLGPNDILKYTLDFQIADHVVVDGLAMTSIVPDGQEFMGMDRARLTIFGVSEEPLIDVPFSGLKSGQMNPQASGASDIVFDIAGELKARGLSSVVYGGGTAGGQGQAVRGQVTFLAEVQESFVRNFPSGDASVDEGDQFQSTSSIAGQMLDPESGRATSHISFDDTSTDVRVPVGALATEIHAINGSTDFSDPAVKAGDEVTLRIRRAIRSSDIESLVISDYLPIPVLEVDSLQFANSAELKAGRIHIGPSDTFHKLYGHLPAVSVDSGRNVIEFDYGSFDSAQNTTTMLDLLVTVQVADKPFADGLWLTSHATSDQGTTNNSSVHQSAFANVLYTRPVIEISKGAVASDNPGAQFNGNVSPSGISFSGPGSPQTFSGTFEHNAAQRVDADITGVDAGDLVRIAVVAENVGLSADGAFGLVLRDAIPAGYSIPTTGLNLQIQDGASQALSFEAIDAGDSVALFGSGIRILNNVSDISASDGTSFVVITYDLQVNDDVAVLDTNSAAAEVLHYTAVEGGENYVTTPVNDDVTLVIAAPSVAHTRIATDQTHSTGKNVVIGEKVTYQVDVSLPEATAADSQLEVKLPRGLSVDQLLGVSWTSGISFSHSEQEIIKSAKINDIGKNIRNQGRKLILDLGDMNNSNRDNATAEKITITYVATVNNDEGNKAGKRLRAAATFSHAVGASAGKASAVKVIEPKLAVNRSLSNVGGDAGDRVTVTVDVTHSSSSADAFDVSFTETMPSNWNYVDGSMRVAGASEQEFSFDGGTLSGTLDALGLNKSFQLTYDVVLSDSVQAGNSLTSTADVQWTSLPGESGQRSSHSDLAFERNGDISSAGTIANTYLASASSTFQIAAPDVSIDLVSTSADFTNDNVLTIGETAVYEVHVRVPEGRHELSLNTLMPTSDDVLHIESFELQSIGSNLRLGEALPLLADSNNDDQWDDTASINLGVVENAADNQQDAGDLLTFRLVVNMVDDPANREGDQTAFTSTVDYGLGSAAAKADVHTAEPGVQVSMTPPSQQVDAGDTVEFRVVLSHNPDFSSSAQDVTFRAISGSRAITLLTGSAQTSNGRFVDPISIDGHNMHEVNGATVLARRVDENGNVVGQATLINDSGRIGIKGNSGSGVNNQIGLDPNTVIAEQLVIEFDSAFNGGSFDFSRLFLNEGNNRGASGHEQGSWTALSNGQIIASDVFVATQGSHSGKVDLALPAGASADTLLFTPTEYSGGQNGSTRDSSDFFIDQLTVHRGVEFELTQLAPGETVEITFLAKVDETAVPGETLDIIGETTWTSLSEGGRIYAAEVGASLQVNASGLSGWAFLDQNQDGKRADVDLGLNGNTILLSGIDHLGNTVETQTHVSPTGYYEFTGLRPGNYELHQEQFASFADGRDYLGSLGGQMVNDRFREIVIPAGSNLMATDYNFTESPLTWVSGAVFVDSNHDGALGQDEDGVGGVTIHLEGQTDLGIPLSRSIKTNHRGYFVFASLPSGTYSLKQEQPEGYFDSTEQAGSQGGEVGNDSFTGIRAGVGTPGEYYNFGEYRPSSVSGRVYIDFDRDLVRDRKDGLINAVDVELSGVDYLGQEVSLSTTTDLEGQYSFAGLRPGTYQVSSVSLVGLQQGASNVGTFRGSSSFLDTSGISAEYGFKDIVLPNGVQALGYDIGHLDPNHEPSVLAEEYERQYVFNGTGEDDAISLAFSTDSAVVNVNGKRFDIDGSATTAIHVLGSFGNDTIKIAGSAHKEEANIRKDSARVTGTWFSSLIYGLESINFSGGGEEDLVRFYDTIGDDFLSASPFQATFSGEGFEHSVYEIHRIYGVASKGGNDIAELSGSARRDNFIATPERAKLYDGDYYISVANFDKVTAEANDESDRAYLHGRAHRQDALVASEFSAQLSGEAYQLLANNFRYVLANGGTGEDTAQLKGTDSDDTFNARPTESTLDAGQTRIITRQFEDVDVEAGDGVDTAYFRDSHYDDVFKADATTAELSNAVSVVTTHGFDKATAYAEAGGFDQAIISGGNSADTFKAWTQKWEMKGEGYELKGHGFRQAIATANSDDDRAYLYDGESNDVLLMTEEFAGLSGERFDNQALGFGRVVVEAKSGGLDRAVFHDGESRSTVRFNGDRLTVFGSGFSNNAMGFEATDVFYADLHGNDRVELSGDLDIEMIAEDVADAGYRLSLAAGNDGNEDSLRDRVSNIPLTNVN